MKIAGRLTLILALVIGATAVAHEGVRNEAVKARMDLMGKIGSATKVIGEMAKGETDFDAGAARSAARRIATHAARVPELFEAEEDDPKSEARQAIWQDFADFTAKSEEMREAAASVEIASKADLRKALARIGGTCKACHEAYRE